MNPNSPVFVYAVIAAILAFLIFGIRHTRRRERIACAAIKYPDIGVLWLPRPARHHHIMWTRLLIDGQRTAGEAEQGFMTTERRFVGREEGLKIAMRHKQIKQKHGNENLLFSEDIWDTPPEARGYRIVHDEDEDK